MQPFSPHNKFFSSLKQVEKRLKSEHSTTPPPQQFRNPSSTLQSSSSTDQLSAPLYLYSGDQSTSNTTQSSHPPLEFLSPSQSDFRPPSPLSNVSSLDQEVDNDQDDDIQQLLGLLEIDKENGNSEMKYVGNRYGGAGGGESFYSKVVGVKGPKSDKEVERLDGWIKYFLESDGEEGVKEPLRLVHLLIGKAIVATEEEGSSHGFGDIEFPSTVGEFLRHGPPT